MPVLTKPKCEACIDELRRQVDWHGVWPIVIPPHARDGICRMR